MAYIAPVAPVIPTTIRFGRLSGIDSGHDRRDVLRKITLVRLGCCLISGLRTTKPEGDAPASVPKADFAVELNLARVIVGVSVELRKAVAACFNDDTA